MEIAAASFPGIYLMGMCSRQERIQKDIDVVIQKSRAEKDCLFAGEFVLLGSWDLEPASPPAAPLPRFLTATRVAGGCGATSPRSRCIWKQLQRRELEPQGEGGTRPSTPPPKPPTRPGQSPAPGGRTRAIRVEGPGAGFQPSAAPVASEPCLSAPAGRAAAAERGGLESGGFAPSAERRRPGRDPLRRAALRCSRQAPRPPEKAALGRAPAPLRCTRSSASAQDTAPGKGWIPGVPEPRRPSLGGRFASIFAPPAKGRGQFGFLSPKPGRGCFRLPGWEIPAVAMAPGTCCGGRPPAAPRGVLRIPSRTALLAAPRSPAFASPPHRAS